MRATRRYRPAFLVVLSVAVQFCVVGAQGVISEASDHTSGLVGAWYGKADLTEMRTGVIIRSLDQVWDARRGYGNVWSARWEGFLVGPIDGKVNLSGQCNRRLTVELAGQRLISINNGKGRKSVRINMVKGKRYLIVVKYMHKDSGIGNFKVAWSWDGQEKTAIGKEHLEHSPQQERYWNLQVGPDPETFDFSKLRTVPSKNVYVYKEPGRFGGWPANNGVWIWANEILVGLERGYHDAHSSGGHAIRRDKPQLNVLARSVDGGETWKIEDPDNFVDDKIDEAENYKDCPGLDFAHPDFAMRVGGRRFFVSYDRGRKWAGPYRVKITGKALGRFTSRTDYIVGGPKDCLVFMSADTGVVESNYQDRSLCARTTDGGKSFEFQGWMTHNVEVRSVMSSTVYAGDKHLVAAMRRKHEKGFKNRPSITSNWIDVYQSKDDGKSWKFLSKVAKTDLGDRNGNPPAMIRLKDGRLCVAYGYRAFPYGIRVKLSGDNGKTWGEEIYLRHDGGTWDLGYPRMVQRPDGKVVTMYYFNTKEVPAQHIAATIWDPDQVK
jgi:hypothetical protein